MLLLAFETSAKAASVALHDGEKLLGECYQNTGLTHSQTLLDMAQTLLSQCGFTAQQVTDVAVAAGPGSFTGVRIGVAAAKGFAWGAEIPCWGVSTLESMALLLQPADGIVCCVMDARREQVYNALFYVNQCVLTRGCEDRAISLAQLAEELECEDRPIYLVGDGSRLTYRTLKDRLPGLILPPEHQMHQRASGVALAALDQMQQGVTPNAAELTPNYLRLSQAERERMEKLQKKEI